MPRRGENIHKRKDGRWEGRYKKGINANGKTAYGSVYASTYRGVKAKLQSKQHDVVFGAVPIKERYSFNEVACLWLRDSQLSLKGASAYRYRNLLDTHILPELGNRYVDQISGADINAYLASKLAHGRVDGKGGLSASYVRSIMLVIRAVLAYAAENRMCLPFQTKICKPQFVSKEVPVLTQSQQKLLENVCMTQINETKVCVLLSLYAGLRIGEICALEWEDLDLENRLIHVRKTVSRISGTTENMARSVLVITPPKTTASFRVIPLCSWLVPVLKQLYGNRRSSFVASSHAEFVSPRTFDYRYHKLLKAAGVQTINYHALRHTFATRCIEAGVDVKTLSELLGHTDASITLNTYVHSSMDRKRTQLEMLRP
ncbi:MAG: site-specific integrase [Oscillospiraceae bacterium]|nr:site-specific integrase [Oscillospiraceae bacterium]